MGSFPSKRYRVIADYGDRSSIVTLCDRINFLHILYVKESCKFLISDNKKDRVVESATNLIYFFDHFYEKLYEKERIFESFFKGFKHRIMVFKKLLNFICMLDLNNRSALQKKFRALSLSHQERDIQMWMFVVFNSTLIETLITCFSTHFDQNTIHSWYICLRFCSDNIISHYDTNVSYVLNIKNGSP